MTETSRTYNKFRDRALLWAAERLGAGLIRALGGICRYRVVGENYFETALQDKRGVILALWHGRMLLPIYHLRGRGIFSLVSLSLDGEIIARIVSRLGYIPRRGSPRLGGSEGFRAMFKDVLAGGTVAIFPDGPTGPRHNVRDGIIQLARLSGAPIVPMSFAALPAWQIKSWDKFMIMKPFSRAVIVFGEGFFIPRTLNQPKDIEYHRRRIHDALCEVEELADRSVIEPNEN